MRILRVFPQRTSYTPRDDLVEIGEPKLFTPRDVDEVHVSCTFSWHKQVGYKLRKIYRDSYKCPVLLGGPAYATETEYPAEFIPGRYVRKGITYTSRGCDFNCPWCMVPAMEGKFREIPVMEGNEIQDNNILLSSSYHWDKVISMLRTQKSVRFVGGLDSRLLTSKHVDDLRSLSIKELWFSYDETERWKAFSAAAEKLRRAGFPRYKLRCYMLVKYDKRETVRDAEMRLRDCWRMGFKPFAQLYRDASGTRVKASKEWRDLARTWSRPAATARHMKEIESKEGE